MTDHRRPMQKPGVGVSGRATRPVLLGGPQPVVLNETALAIWDLCDGSTSVDEMVQAVVELVGIAGSQARSDVEGVIDQLAALDVITEVDPPSDSA